MQPVGLVELRIQRHAVEQERIKRHVVGLCKLGINAVERLLILFPEIGRCQHAGQQQLGAARLDLGDHCVEVGADRCRIDAAQHVVGAEFEDHDVGLLGERPIESGEPSGRRIAGDPAIDDVNGEPIGAQFRLEPGRKRLVRRQAEAGSEAVAKGEDLRGLGDRRCRAGAHAKQRAKKRRRCATHRPPQARHRIRAHRNSLPP